MLYAIQLINAKEHTCHIIDSLVKEYVISRSDFLVAILELATFIVYMVKESLEDHYARCSAVSCQNHMHATHQV